MRRILGVVGAIGLSFSALVVAGGSGAEAVGPNVVKNGSFESPVVSSPCLNGGGGNPTPGICTYSGGSTGITGWTVGGNSVDLIAAATIKPATGHQSIDLSGSSPGSVTQTVTTTPGIKYTLRWAVAGNGSCGQAVKTMGIYWNGTQVKTINFNTAGHTLQSMGWVVRHMTVTAVGVTSSIGFADLTPDHSLCGATLDAVSLRSA